MKQNIYIENRKVQRTRQNQTNKHTKAFSIFGTFGEVDKNEILMEVGIVRRQPTE